MLAPDAVLDAIAASLRTQIGPAVSEPFAKTQAFMAAVILEKVAGQLRAGPAGDGDSRRATVADVRRALGEAPPPAVDAALCGLEHDNSAGRWRDLVETLYAARHELGAERFDASLGRVRIALRARLDRVLADAT